MSKLLHLRSRIVNTPLAITPAKLNAIISVLGPRLEIDIPLSAAGMDRGSREPKGYVTTGPGIAVIPVQGTLMKRGSGILAQSGLSTYEQIGTALGQALADGGVKGILLDVDSPGGETVGLFELCDQLYAARKSKPIFASVNDCAASAAYAIASCAQKIWITRMGAAGSIGVYCLHLDESGADRKAGIGYTYLFAGARKIDGNPHQPLSTAAQESLQAEIDREYDVFVSTVARNRGVTALKVRNTEAELFYGPNAVPLLADQVGTLEDALAALGDRVSKPSGTRKAAQSGRAATEPRREKVIAAREPAMTDIELIAAYCEAAGKPELAFDYVVAGKTPDEVAGELMAEQEEEQLFREFAKQRVSGLHFVN